MKSFRNTFRARKFFNTPLKRSLFLGGVPLFICCWYSAYIFSATLFHTPVFITQDGKYGLDSSGSKPVIALRSFTFLNDLTHLPLSFLDFDVYALNTTDAYSGDGVPVELVVGTNILGKYSEVKPFHLKKIYSGLNIEDMRGLETSEHSIRYTGTLPGNTAGYLSPSKSGYWSFLLPTSISFILLWFALTAGVYGLIVLFGLYLKFVLFGEPISTLFESQ